MKKVTVEIPDEDYSLLKEGSNHGDIAEFYRTCTRYFLYNENGSNILPPDLKKEIDYLKNKKKERIEKEDSKKKMLIEAFNTFFYANIGALAKTGLTKPILEVFIEAMRLSIYKKYEIAYADAEIKRYIRKEFSSRSFELDRHRTEIIGLKIKMGELDI